MLLFVFVFISVVISQGTTDNDDGRYRIFSCSLNQLQCLNETCVSSLEECGNGEFCILPQYPSHGTNTLPNVLVPHPGQTFRSFLLRMECDQKYGVVESDGSVTVNGTHEMLCVYGKLLPETLPECVRYCTLTPDPSGQYKCRIPGSNVFIPCPQHVPDGTTVDPQCRAPVYSSPRNLLFMNCLQGSWDYVAKCEADCGRITPEGSGLVINGTTVRRGELPWHVGIYTKTTSPYEQICGGTLVSNNLVISAAHCFWNEEEKLPASDFAVAVGKLYSQWRSKHDKESQESDVKEILIPGRFQGTGSTLQSDLAALILVTPIVFKVNVKPVCISFSRDFERVQLQNGNVGKVGGWGLSVGNSSRSDVLKIVELPYVGYNRYFQEVPLSFQQFITLDKFCAGYANGTTVCKGDSGGGLVFATPDQHTERYYLRGVVSAASTGDGKTCKNDHYATFTRIADYDEFIKKALQGRSLASGASPSSSRCTSSQFQCDNGTCVDRKEDCKEVQKHHSRCVTGSEPSCSAKGTNTKKREQVPWHVGVYDVAHYTSVCGGSIVSPLAIISTSSCYRRDRNVSSQLVVVAGQTYRRISDPRNVEDHSIQYSYVQALFATNEESEPNIAVLTLHHELVYNMFIKPVSLIYDGNFDCLAFRSVKAGWDPDTEELTSLDLPYIRAEHCNYTLPPDDRKYLKDALCTGYFGHTHSVASFEGGGLVYKETKNGTEQYFLRGVMATVKTCGKPNSCLYNFNSYVIFSELKTHEKYLKRFFQYIVPRYNQIRSQLKEEH